MHQPLMHRLNPHRRKRRPAAALIGLVLAVSTLLTGCAALAPLLPKNTETTMDPAAELAARPRLEEMVARYEQMQQQLGDRLDAELGPHLWYQDREASNSPCSSPYDDVNGRQWRSGGWKFDGPIRDQDWPRALQILAEVTAEYGFTLDGLAIDQPGRHHVNGFDHDLDAHFEFGTQDHTRIYVKTGCHLP
jgi:hypothetical protein